MNYFSISSILPMAICVFGYDGCMRKEVIESLGDRQEIVLEKRECQSGVHSVTVKGKGKILGKGRIALVTRDEETEHEWESELIENEIEFEWNEEWYANEARIVYTPITDSSGFINIRYAFNKL